MQMFLNELGQLNKTESNWIAMSELLHRYPKFSHNDTFEYHLHLHTSVKKIVQNLFVQFALKGQTPYGMPHNCEVGFTPSYESVSFLLNTTGAHIISKTKICKLFGELFKEPMPTQCQTVPNLTNRYQ